jgi:hypothetical protein
MRRRSLQRPGEFGNIRFHPALLVHGFGAAFEDIDRARQTA